MGRDVFGSPDSLTPEEGVDATGIIEPTGGVGVRGWLSGIYAKLNGTLSVSVTTLPLPTGAAVESGGNLATTTAQTILIATATGTPEDTSYSGTGAGTIVSLLKSVIGLLNSKLATKATPLTYTISESIAVGTTSTQIVAAGFITESLILSLPSGGTANIYLNVTGGPAVIGTGIPIWAGEGEFVFGGAIAIPTAAISAISDSGSVQLMIAGG